MKLNTENIDLGINNKSKNKKLSKQTVLLIGVVVLFILTIVFVFNLEDKTKINDVNSVNNNSTKMNDNQIDTNKINAIAAFKEAAKTSSVEQTKPPLQVQTQEQEQSNQIDTNKINAAENQIINTQAQEQEQYPTLAETDFLVEENRALKMRIDNLEKENQNLRMQKINTKNQVKNEDKNSKNEDKNIQNEMKTYLNSIKSEIRLKGSNFHFAGKNYYVGDKINGYEIRDIQKNNIRTCNQDWCYTLFL